MISEREIDRIVKLTAEALSQPFQSDMLDFFIEMKGRRFTVPEKWVQTEIVRKMHREKSDVNPNENRTIGYDFRVNDIRIELKTSASFTYKRRSAGAKKNRLFDAIEEQHKDADYWMFVTKYEKEKEAKMRSELKLRGEYFCKREMIPNTSPEWCVFLIIRKSELAA